MSKVHVVYAADDGSLPVKTDEEAREMLAQRREVEFHEYYESIREWPMTRVS